MVDNLLIAIDALSKHMLILLSVDEILLPRKKHFLSFDLLMFQVYNVGKQ